MKPAFFEPLQRSVEEGLERFFPAAIEEMPWLTEAMRHSLFAPGKRLRPILTLEVARVLGGGGEEALPAACAVEMIHTFSLVHDDLPALDDDDQRRGRPSCHRVYGEALAILAGDGLLAAAFRMVAHHISEAGVASRVQGQLAEATWRLIRGQVADIQWEGTPSTVGKVERIHQDKTASLLGCAARVGAIVARATEEEEEVFGRYGEALGQAFQIVDDLLDVTGVSGCLGKATGKDRLRGKITDPAVHGVEGSRERARVLVEEAKGYIVGYPEGERLGQLADYLVERCH